LLHPPQLAAIGVISLDNRRIWRCVFYQLATVIGLGRAGLARDGKAFSISADRALFQNLASDRQLFGRSIIRKMLSVAELTRIANGTDQWLLSSFRTRACGESPIKET
jgi:hypothetical protein